jgi:hypothetical protein
MRCGTVLRRTRTHERCGVAALSSRISGIATYSPIDLVLIDQQSVGKRSLHLMDTVIAKKRWTTIYWRVNKFLKDSRFGKQRESFLKINDFNDI